MVDTISHAVLTGDQLHEPKGIENANIGEVYVSNGSGSGNWASLGISSFTGQIADFAWPVAQSGWLECDGSYININTYPSLFSVLTIQRTGNRSSGSAIITSLPSTTGMKVGYYVFGTGITAGTQIISIDSSAQITMSGTAASSGSATVIVSPWYLGTDIIRLPDVSTAGRYRRSRVGTNPIGVLQDSQNLAHTHTASGVTGDENIGHTHDYSGTTSAMNGNQNPSVVYQKPIIGGTGSISLAGGSGLLDQPNASATTNIDHTHTYAGSTTGASTAHVHPYSLTTSSNGSSEARPTSIVLMTCIKT